MFKKLMSLFAPKKEQKKSIGFSTDEVKEDDKFYNVHETFCIWCAYMSKEEGVDGHKGRYAEGARNKNIFVKRAEIKKWRFIDGDWYCPACVKEKK